MNGYQTYQQYIALKAHFGGNYDYFKYNGKIKSANETAYAKRNDKHFFELVGRKVEHDDVIPFLVANFIKDDDIWVGKLIENYEEARETFVEWKKKLSSLYVMFQEDINNIVAFLDEKSLDKNELFRYTTHSHPLIFRFLIEKMIEPETFILLDDALNFVSVLDKHYKNDIIWTMHINKINKFRRFIIYDKSKVSNIIVSKFKPQKSVHIDVE